MSYFPRLLSYIANSVHNSEIKLTTKNKKKRCNIKKDKEEETPELVSESSDSEEERFFQETTAFIELFDSLE